jgi:alkylation response protein AidB-like acyl-CoA dehydrogenase
MMDYELNADQHEVVDALRGVLEARAGTSRARSVLAGEGFDAELFEALREFGLFSPDLISEYGPHLVTVLIEEVSAHAGILPIGTEVFVRHALGLEDAAAPLALIRQNSEPAVPFGAQARTLVRVGDGVELLDGGWDVTAEHRTFPVPLASIDCTAATGSAVDADPLATAAWWRLGIAAEMVGAATAALRITIDHLVARTQFGQPLASRQAIQHRLSEVHVKIEGARWLTRYAAHQNAEPVLAAAAAAASATMARLVMWEAQQLQGAIGFTREYDLHLFTLRLHVLRLILDGGRDGHAIEAARLRWASSTAAV